MAHTQEDMNAHIHKTLEKPRVQICSGQNNKINHMHEHLIENDMK